MAIVVALNNKRQSRAGLSCVISYVANDRKTLLQSGEKLVSGINCSPHSAYDEFMLTKHLHSKTNGRYFYHYCQSFSPEEKVTPKTVHEIGVRLTKEFFDGYEVIVGTHIEKNHLHNHIIINSVSFESGKKLHQDKKSLENIRTVSDKICSEYGLSVIKHKEQKSSETMTHGEYTAATLGNSWKFRLINTIEAAMNICKNKAEFISYMESEGYKVSWTNERKSICYTTPGGKKCRDYRLHEDKFLKENMENEFNFRGIKKYEPTDAGLNTDFKSPGFLEEKIEALSHQDRDRLTAELNLLSTQVGKIQEELFTKTEKGLKKIRIAVYRITVALVISIISITALVKGCLALLNLFRG